MCIRDSTNAYFTLMAGVIVAAFVVTDLIVTRRTGTGIAIFHRLHEGAAVANYVSILDRIR